MKRHQNRNGERRRLFESVVSHWNTGRRTSSSLVNSGKRRLTQAVVVGAVSLVGLGSWGEDDPTLLDDVVVTGAKERKVSSPKYTQPLRDTPQTITVVPQQLIKEQGAVTLRDVLRNVPGISIQAGEGGVPLGDNLSIRGFAARTDIFVDGVRDVAGNTRDPFSVEQVEVIKGPASAVAGRGSTGGMVNMVSKTPTLKPFLDLSAGLGTDVYRRATLDVNQPMGKTMSLRLNALWHDAATPDRDAVEDTRWGLAPSLAFGLGTPTRVTVSTLHMKQDNVPDYGIPWVPATNNVLTEYRDKPAPVDDSNFYGLTARDFETVKTNVGTLLLEQDFGSSSSVRNLTRGGRTDRLSVVTAPRFVSDNSTAINRQLQDRDQVDDILANQTDLTARFQTGGARHALVTGVEVSRETNERHRLIASPAPLADLYNPDPSQPFSGSVTRSGAKTDVTADSVGVYAFDTVSLGERWEIPLGVRWDSFAVDSEDQAVTGTVTALDRTDRMGSGRGGLVFKPRPEGSIYAGYGNSFNPAGEGFALSNAATNAANVNLDPEETRTFELGTKWDVLGGRTALTGALFQTDKLNARTEDPANAGDVLVLEGKQRVRGVEFGVTGRLTDRWDLFAGSTFLDSEVLSSKNPAEVGKELANTPKVSHSVWTSYQPVQRWTVGAGLQHVGARFSSNTNVRQAPSYTLYDAMVSFEPAKAVTLRANVNNVMDEDYFDRVGGGHIIPGPGRRATLATDVRF